MIQMKVDTAALRAAIAEEIKNIDKKGEACSNQILEEGKIAAYANANHDTNYMRGDGLDAGSKVERISPCVFKITLGSIADYTVYQEFDPKRGRPFIRPGAMVMQVKAPEIIDRNFGD
ncbi:MAG: hypothetical protein WC455_21180 [Dehalococcoidia bacterium]|jgi:hypothetical protein